MALTWPEPNNSIPLICSNCLYLLSQFGCGIELNQVHDFCCSGEICARSEYRFLADFVLVIYETCGSGVIPIRLLSLVYKFWVLHYEIYLKWWSAVHRFSSACLYLSEPHCTGMHAQSFFLSAGPRPWSSEVAYRRHSIAQKFSVGCMMTHSRATRLRRGQQGQGEERGKGCKAENKKEQRDVSWSVDVFDMVPHRNDEWSPSSVKKDIDSLQTLLAS